LETGRALRTLEGHSDWVYGAAVTEDGKRAVSASWDRTLSVGPGYRSAHRHIPLRRRCPLLRCAAPNRIVAGDKGGRVYFLALEE